MPFVGLLWRLDTAWRGCRTEVPYCVRPPSDYVHDHVAWTTQPLEEPPDERMLAPAIEGLAARAHAVLLQRLSALGLRRSAPDAHAAAGRVARRGRPRQRGTLLRSRDRRAGMNRDGGAHRARRAAGRRAGPHDRRRRSPRRALSASATTCTRSPIAARTAARRCARAAARCTASPSATTGRCAAPSAHSMRCPWHKWDFDIATGRCLVHPSLRVRRYRVTIEPDELIVHLDHPRESESGRSRKR